MKSINKRIGLRTLGCSCILLLGSSLAHATAMELLAGRAPHKQLSWAQTTGHLIVHYRTTPTAALRSTTHLQTMSKTALMPLTYHHTMGSGSHVLQLPKRMTVNDAQKVAQRLARDPNVLYVEPTYTLHTDAVPNDPLFHLQWALGSTGGGINMESAWNITQGSPNIVMAVVDSGILKDHPEFQGRLVPGYNFISDPTTAGNKTGRGPDNSDTGDFCQDGQGLEPSDWHGSHVAGIMGARAGNKIGIAGINPRSMILPVRVIGRCGGAESDAIDAMRWAAGLAVPGVPANAHPARVINMSLGGIGACPQELQLAINEVRARGAVVVVSAGNDGVDAAGQLPANCKNVITVAAVDQLGNKVQNSLWATNYGSVVTIGAPGEHILSSVNAGLLTATTNNYGYLDGTSQASPQVAATIALMLSINPRLTAAGVTDLLIKSRRPFAAKANCAGICQAGMLDAARAVTLARESLGTPATPNDTSSSKVPLVISAGAAQTLLPRQAATLHGSARTATSATIRSWRWQQLSGTHVALSSSSVAQPRFVTPATTGALVFRLTVTDSRNAVASSTTQVKVVAATTRASIKPAAATGSSGNASASTNGSAAASTPTAGAPAATAGNLLGSIYSWMSSLLP